MRKLEFKQEIQASAQKVYDTMLGLTDKSTYDDWAKTFNPTSTFEGTWEKGSKILFVGQDENGKRGGMVSEVVENIPGKFVSIRHDGFLDGDQEISTGEMVEQWAGGHENYRFEEENGMTTVTVELDTVEDYVGFFEDKYPKALEKLKEIAEK
jgi:hypothetical protein